MNFSDIDAYLKTKDTIRVAVFPQWKVIRYTVNDSLFAEVGIQNNRPTLTVKSRSADLLRQREAFPQSVVPAVSQEPLHWNTVYLDQDIPPETIWQMIDISYDLQAGYVTAPQIAPSGNAFVRYKDVCMEFDFQILYANEGVKKKFIATHKTP